MNKVNRGTEKVRISMGGFFGTVVNPKKLFKICLDYRANAIILGHNHQGGVISPSEADQMITKKIKNCVTLLDIAPLDHIIIAGDWCFSFADEGTL